MPENSASEGSVLRISGLSFAYEAPKNQPRSWTIKDLSLSINAGEIVSILGASGSGKSTLLNLIAGLLTPQEGTIEISAKEKSKQQIGYIFQQDALFPWNTVEANIMLAAKLNIGISKQAAREKMGYYLRAFHLKEQIVKSYPAQLSGGMRQRVSIIQSLMFEPQLLLLDEPFSALDFYTKLRLESEFYSLIKEKKNAAIFVTHDIEEAIAVSDSIWIMSKEGTLTSEFSTGRKSPDYLPENARGTARFAELYQSIWSELKMVIAE